MKKIKKIIFLSALLLSSSYIAQIDKAPSNSIKALIENSAANETITLSQDEDNITVPEGKDINIDLNGYTLKTLTNNGKARITNSKDTGGISLTSSISETSLAIKNYGEMVVDGVNVKSYTDADNSYPVAIHNYANASLEVLDGEITSEAVGKSYAFGIANEGNLKVSGGKISSYVKNTLADGNNSIGVHNYSKGKITMDGGIIYAESNSNNGYATGIRNQGESEIVSISDGTIYAYVDNEAGTAKSYGIYNQNGTITSISGGTIKGKTEAAEWTFGIWNTSVIKNIEGGTFIADINDAKNSPNAIALANDKTVDSISGGVFYAKSTNPNGGTFGIRTRNSGSYITSITGGAFYINKEADNHYIYQESSGTNTIGENYSLTGKSSLTSYRYILKNSETVSEEYLDNDNIMTGTVYAGETKVKEYKLFGTEKSKASIGETIYSSLSEAIAEAKDNDVVKLTSDNDEAVENTKNITIDLNGHELNNTITNRGTLLLKDSTGLGRIHLESDQNTTIIGVKNYGTLIVDNIGIRVDGLGKETINHGIYNYKGATLTVLNARIRAVSKDVKFGHGIVNEGTIENINNGTIESYSLSTTTASNLVGISNVGGTIKNISGGTIYSQSNGKSGFAIGIRNQSNAVVEKISGGLIKGYSASSSGGTEAKGFGIYNQLGTINEIDDGKIEGRSTAALWAFGIWNPNGSKIGEIKDGEIYGIGQHNYTNSSPNFIALSNEGEVEKISGGLFYASSMHEKGSTFGIRNRGAISSVEGGIFYASKDNSELLRNESGTLNVADGYSLVKLSSKYSYMINTNQIAVEILDSEGNYLSSKVLENGKMIKSHGTTDKKGSLIEGYSKGSYDQEITLKESDIMDIKESTTLYAHYIKAPTFYFLGSSVTYGFATGGVSFVNEIQKTLNCNCDKQAVSGTTLTDNGTSSYVQRMENNFDKNANVDHLIVQLSTNDISQSKPLGTISDSKDINSFNRQTVLGAMEYIIAYAKQNWGCEVIFYTNPCYNNSQYENLISKLYEIQEKWEIGVIDFYNYIDMEPLDQKTLSSYMSDSIHPNSEGYAWMGKIMSKYLKESFEERHPGTRI